MMKKFLVILYILLGLSCSKDLLERIPLDKISESKVFQSGTLINASLDALYETLFIIPSDANYVSFMKEMYLSGELTWRSTTGNNSQIDHVLSLRETSDGMMEYWAYDQIRQCNDFIGKLTAAESINGMDDKTKEIRLAEARFLRMFTYFELAKRYGGVPLILESQELNTDPDSPIWVSRNSEKAIYDFIDTECDELVTILETASEMGQGRINKYVVWAFKSRAMLYAGSIAKYGAQQLDGLLGFPASEAGAYFQKAYDACLEVEKGGYTLYNAEQDKAKNYQMLFLEEDNEEVIFAIKYNGKDKVGHSFSYYAWPGGVGNQTWGAEFAVYLETVLDYDYVDGRSGKDDRALLESNNLIDFTELWADKDPRFHASVLYPGAMFAGGPYEAQHGTYVDGVLKVDNSLVGSYLGFDWFAVSPWTRINATTSFSIKKFLKEDRGIQVLAGESDVDQIVYRYGEILLNRAEAAYELSNTDDALTQINAIRQRAGMPLLSSVDMEAIRHERDIELMFENHKYFDNRRWRTAETVFDNVVRGGISVNFDWETKKYEVTVVPNVDINLRTFKSQHYYLPITLGRLETNPNLAPENPGY